MKYAAVETVKRYVSMSGLRFVRVWFKVDELRERVPVGVNDQVYGLMNSSDLMRCSDMASLIADHVEGVAAVEVTDKNGEGVVIYTEWP